MIKAIVDKEGKVLNIIVYDNETDWTPPDNTVLIDAIEDAEPGGTYDFSTLTFSHANPVFQDQLPHKQEIDQKVVELEIRLANLEKMLSATEK